MTIPASDRNCFMCYRLDIEPGGNGCDTCGYGGEAKLRCAKGHFSAHLSNEVAGDINLARTCPDFVPDEGMEARFGVKP